MLVASPRPLQVRVYHITAAGWERMSEDDSMDLYFKYMGTDAEKAATAAK